MNYIRCVCARALSLGHVHSEQAADGWMGNGRVVTMMMMVVVVVVRGNDDRSVGSTIGLENLAISHETKAFASLNRRSPPPLSAPLSLYHFDRSTLAARCENPRFLSERGGQNLDYFHKRWAE